MKFRRTLLIILCSIIAIELLAILVSVILLDKWAEITALGVFVQSLATCVMVYFTWQMVELTRESTEMRGKLYVHGWITSITEKTLTCELTIVNRARLAQTVLNIYAHTGARAFERISLERHGPEFEIKAGQRISSTFTITADGSDPIGYDSTKDPLPNCEVSVMTAYDVVKYTLYDPNTPRGLYETLNQ